MQVRCFGLIREKAYSFRVHKQGAQGDLPITQGAGAWASILDRHLARRMAEEEQQQSGRGLEKPLSNPKG